MKHPYLLISLFLCFASSKAQTEFKDVADIFYKRCTGCHHEGANHYVFTNYAQISKTAFLIHNALATDKMPPWKADTSYSRFQQERIITASEKQKIIDWISGGIQKGDTTLAPPPPSFTTPFQLAGDADLTLSIGKFTSKSLTNDQYHCFSIKTNLLEDRIIRAFEVVPGNKEIVHHAVISIDTTGTYKTDTSGVCYNVPGNLGLGAYAPGTRATVFPSQQPLMAGIYLKAGSRVIIQLHYPAGTKGMVDSTKIRLYFYPTGAGGVRRIFSVTPLQNWNLSIPANSVSAFQAYYPSANQPLPFAWSVYGVMPHSHLLCTSIINYAVKPGIDTIPLIRINKWDFEWQDYYLFKKLVTIPPGYKLYSKHVFDNTANNFNNPNSPPKHVFAGTDTDDEMLFDGVLYMMYQQGDENIDVEAIIGSDPLLSVTKHAPIARNLRVLAFPNPADAQIDLSFDLPETSATRMEVLDLLGRPVISESLGVLAKGRHRHSLRAASLSAGSYMLKIVTRESVGQTKVLIR